MSKQSGIKSFFKVKTANQIEVEERESKNSAVAEASSNDEIKKLI